MISHALEWLAAHPAYAIGVVAAMVLSILDRIVPYTRVDAPLIARVLRGLLDLVSLLPSHGHELKRGLQIPLLSFSGAPPPKPKAPISLSAGIGVVLLSALLSLPLSVSMGCGGSMSTSAKTLAVLRESTSSGVAIMRERCGIGGERYFDKCKAGDKSACKSFDACHAAAKALHSLSVAVLAASLALETSDEPSAAKAMGAARVAAAHVQRAIEAWR